MLFKILTLAALSGIALGQAGQTFTNPALPSCAVPCLQSMQSVLGCDPNLLTCTCPPLVSLVSNSVFIDCLAKCSTDVPGNTGYALGKNCGVYAWTASTITASVPAITATTAASASAASATKSANAAARSNVGKAAIGLAIAAAMVL